MTKKCGRKSIFSAILCFLNHVPKASRRKIYVSDYKGKPRNPVFRAYYQTSYAQSSEIVHTSPASKIGSTTKSVQRFTRDDILNSLDGVTDKSTDIVNKIQNKDVGINVLGDELFESYLGCSTDTVAMQVGDQIYVRSSSASLLSDVVHEGTYAIDYVNGIEEKIICSWAGEKAAYSNERLFQIESGIPAQFESEEDMMVHIWSNYQK